MDVTHDQRPREELAGVRVTRKLEVEPRLRGGGRCLGIVREQQPQRGGRRIRGCARRIGPGPQHRIEHARNHDADVADLLETKWRRLIGLGSVDTDKLLKRLSDLVDQSPTAIAQLYAFGPNETFPSPSV